jgi:membrane protease YdiL (CAAX protease family)
VNATSRVPYRYVARLLAAIWIGAAAAYVAATKLSLTPWQLRGAFAGITVVILALTLRGHEFRSWLWTTSFGQWAAIDRETHRAPAEAGTYSRTALYVLVTVAVSLTLQEYFGDRSHFERAFPVHGKISPYRELYSFAWWSAWRVFGYVGIPLLVLGGAAAVRRFRRGGTTRTDDDGWSGNIGDCHVSLRHFFSHLWIYAALFLAVLPAVLYASTTASFRETYPFYRLANRSAFDLWTWEALYAAQFIALEFFFRGFILHGLRRALGSNAVFVMIVPYCMIHYGKPLPETLGAIGAGLILGTLAMRTRSIWGGVLIHIGVATTMDVLALRRYGH